MTLPFDPIDEAARQWGERWDGARPMHAVTSLMRVQQLVIGRLDAILKPHGLTFARYEALVLLVFSSRGSLPLGKMGERLQVHPTSVTSIVRRLSEDGLIVRRPHPEDGRGQQGGQAGVRERPYAQGRGLGGLHGPGRHRFSTPRAAGAGSPLGRACSNSRTRATVWKNSSASRKASSRP